MTKVKYTKELIESLVKKHVNVTAILEELGLVTRGGNYNTIRRKIVKYDLDTSHFTGKGWSKGLTAETSETVRKLMEHNTIHKPETSLVENIKLASQTLHRLVEKTNMEKKCVSCGLETEWQGRPISLHLDHINGKNTDNRLENLRYLCPNCHSQTDTFGTRNFKNKLV